jgi:hypothetical protein
LSKLWPEAFASRCACSKLPQPRPVDALSAFKVATGTPVAAEILSKLAARDAMAPNTRTNAAMHMLKLFTVIKSLLTHKRFGFRVVYGSTHARKLRPRLLMPACRESPIPARVPGQSIQINVAARENNSHTFPFDLDHTLGDRSIRNCR